MDAGQQGPLHSFDREQIWYLLEGTLELRVNGERLRLEGGYSIVLPKNVERQVTATTVADAIACAVSDTQASVPGEAEPRGTPPWIS